MTEIETLLDSLGLNKETISDIASKLLPIEVKKGQSFLELNEHVNKIGILIHGFLISKYCDEDANFHTSKFYYPSSNVIITDYNNFLNESKSEELIYAIEDSKILMISKSDYQILFNKYDSIKKLSKQLLDSNYISALKRVRQLQILQNDKRVESFLNSNSEVLLKVPQKDIASYLGMHRNAFGKALKKINNAQNSALG